MRPVDTGLGAGDGRGRPRDEPGDSGQRVSPGPRGDPDHSVPPGPKDILAFTLAAYYLVLPLLLLFAALLAGLYWFLRMLAPV